MHPAQIPRVTPCVWRPAKGGPSSDPAADYKQWIGKWFNFPITALQDGGSNLPRNLKGILCTEKKKPSRTSIVQLADISITCSKYFYCVVLAASLGLDCYYPGKKTMEILGLHLELLRGFQEIVSFSIQTFNITYTFCDCDLSRSNIIIYSAVSRVSFFYTWSQQPWCLLPPRLFSDSKTWEVSEK